MKYIVVKVVKERQNLKIYKTLTRQVVLSGYDNWTHKQADEEKLSMSERKTSGKIYGPSCVNGVWRIKYNYELHNLYRV
jgi:hypothetical protein